MSFKDLTRAFTPFRNLLAARPILATFQVNLRCNSACGYCDLPLNVGRYELTREEIKRTFSRLYRDGVRFVLVQGGEPLLRRDLPEILEDLSAIGLHLTLITNGTKITPQLVERSGSAAAGHLGQLGYAGSNGVSAHSRCRSAAAGLRGNRPLERLSSAKISYLYLE